MNYTEIQEKVAKLRALAERPGTEAEGRVAQAMIDSIVGKQQTEQEKRSAANALRAKLAAESWAQILAQKPEGAQALIIATLRKDESDSMSDYWGHSNARKVAIGWRMSKRESFKELRKAAAKFEPTAEYGPGKDIYKIVALDETGYGQYLRDEHYEIMVASTEAEAIQMAEARRAAVKAECEAGIAERGAFAFGSNADANLMHHGYRIDKTSVENRENYSMGGGNYLGASRHSGWIVSSTGIGGSSWEVIEDGLNGDTKPVLKIEAAAVKEIAA